MAKCAGCSGGGAVNHVDTECVQMNGDGSLLDPLSAILEFHPASKICLDCFSDGLGLRFSETGGLNCGASGLEIKLDPDVSNTLSLSGAGLLGTGGGGGGGQVLYITVGTPGVGAFGGIGATPPAMLATADYVGDGINDSTVIQAAIDAADTFVATIGVGAIVLILPGIYIVNTPLRPKGIPLIGQEVDYVVFYTATFAGAPANTRTIDATIAGAQFTHIENIQINNLNGGAAVIKSQALYMVNCVILGDGKGADDGLIDVGHIISPTNGYGRFDSNVISGTSTPFPDPGLIIRDVISSNYSISHCTFTADVVFTGSNHNNANIHDNTFQASNLKFNTFNLIRFTIRNNTFSGGSIIATLAGGTSYQWSITDNAVVNGNINVNSLSYSQIQGNYIEAPLFGNGMDITTCAILAVQDNIIASSKFHGMLITSLDKSIIQGNKIRGYGAGGANQDGIRVITSDGNSIQDNHLDTVNGKYGINMVSGNSNFVTNNMLLNSGLTASFNDTATGTVTVAGNRL